MRNSNLNPTLIDMMIKLNESWHDTDDEAFVSNANTPELSDSERAYKLVGGDREKMIQFLKLAYKNKQDWQLIMMLINNANMRY